MQEYDQIYEWYLDARNNVTGVESVLSAFGGFKRGATVVDLGCGTGLPLASVVTSMGLRVIGVDSSEQMINAFKANFPDAEANLIKVQNYTFPKAELSGALCWGCLFHLLPDDQIKVLGNVFSSITSGGRFLFTAAKEKDYKTGEMDGVIFQYYSLGSEKYNELAEKAGWRLIHESEDEGKNYEYLFEKL